MACKLAGYKFYLNCGKYLWILGQQPIPAIFEPYLYNGGHEDLTNRRKVFSWDLSSEMGGPVSAMKRLTVQEALEYFNTVIKDRE